MHLFTSLILTALLLTGVTPSSPNSTAQTSLNGIDQPAHLARKRGQPKHRGSGRIEFVNFVDAYIS